MSSLFKKLNTLVRASINDALGDVVPSGSRRVDPGRLGKNIDAEIASLRERINEAIAHEGVLKQRLDALWAEVAELDRAADAAVEVGQQDEARRLIARMQSVQRRAEMAASDLREHQLVTEELIQRVNLLDAVVADARRAQTIEAEMQAPAEVSPPATATERGPVKVLSDLLRDARQSVDKAGDAVADETERTRSELTQSAAPEAVEPAHSRDVDDDLAARLKRLSKPD